MPIPRFAERHWGTVYDVSPTGFVPGFLGTLRWSPDGKALQYVLTSNSASNIWEQSLSALKPEQLTHFNSGEIFDFSWTADREHMLMTRGQSKRDIVLLSHRE